MQHRVLKNTFLCHLFELFENHHINQRYTSKSVFKSRGSLFGVAMVLNWFFVYIKYLESWITTFKRKHIWNCTSRFTPTSLFLWAVVSPGKTSTTGPPYKNLNHIHPKQLEPSFYFESRRTEDRTRWARRSKWLCLVLATLASPPLPNSLSGGSRCRLL